MCWRSQKEFCFGPWQTSVSESQVQTVRITMDIYILLFFSLHLTCNPEMYPDMAAAPSKQTDLIDAHGILRTPRTHSSAKNIELLSTLKSHSSAVSTSTDRYFSSLKCLMTTDVVPTVASLIAYEGNSFASQTSSLYAVAWWGRSVLYCRCIKHFLVQNLSGFERRDHIASGD